MTKARSIAYQGEPGANSHIACVDNYPDLAPMPCATFEDAFAALQDGSADLGMIPIENSIAGRVADIHALLPASGLHIVGETFLPIHFQLLAVPGARIEDLQDGSQPCPCARPVPQHHPPASPQARGRRATPPASAREVAEGGDKSRASLATRLAAEIYGLQTLVADVEDESHNTTRFVVLSRRSALGRRRATGRSSPPSSSGCATCRPRSTRRWAASPPTASI